MGETLSDGEARLSSYSPAGGPQLRGKALPDWAREFDCDSWAQFLLKWIVGNENVTCVIPATGNPRHLEDNMRAGLGRLPDAKTRKRMVELVGGL